MVEIDVQLYMVEVKWWHERLGPGEVAQHQVRVFNRGQARGIFISATGYTDAAIQSCRESLHRAPFVLCDLEEIVRHLEAQRPLVDLFRPKIQGSSSKRIPSSGSSDRAGPASPACARPRGRSLGPHAGQAERRPSRPAPKPRVGFLKGDRHVAAASPRTQAAATSRQLHSMAGPAEAGRDGS